MPHARVGLVLSTWTRTMPLILLLLLLLRLTMVLTSTVSSTVSEILPTVIPQRNRMLETERPLTLVVEERQRRHRPMALILGPPPL